MENFKLILFSTSELRGTLDISYTAEQSQIISDLLYVFNAKFDAESQQFSIDYKHKNTSAFQSRLNKFISKYKCILPQIQKLGAKFKNLEDDEWFFVLPPIEIDTKQKYQLERASFKTLNSAELKRLAHAFCVNF